MSCVLTNKGKILETRRNSSTFAYIGMEVETHHMDFVIGLPRTQTDHDAIWVIVDRLTKSTHFLATHGTFSLDRLARLYIDEVVKFHRVSVTIVSDRDPRFTSQF